MTVREVLRIRLTQRLARAGWAIKAYWGSGRRGLVCVDLGYGFAYCLGWYALWPRDFGLSLTPIKAISGQGRCADGTTGKKSDERRWILSKVASSEGEGEGEGEIREREGEGREKIEEKKYLTRVFEFFKTRIYTFLKFSD